MSHTQRVDVFRFRNARDVHRATYVDSDTLKSPALIVEYEIVLGRHIAHVRVHGEWADVYRYKLFRMRIRKRLQKDAVNDAENRGVRADAESERKHSDSREARRFTQHAESEAQILQNCFDEMRSGGFAALFLEFLIAAEFDASAALGFRARDAGAHQILCAIFEMGAQFFIHVRFEVLAMEERRKKNAK